MNAKKMHTPGEWVLTDRGTPYAQDAGSDSGLYVHAENPRRTIAVCDCSQRLSDEEMQANARLIAAAPELLAYAECEEARSQSEDIAETVLKRHGFNSAEYTAIEFMDRMRRAAIAKARG